MTSPYLKMVPVPAASDINSGLAPAHQATMLHLFGKPGRLTDDCSPITNPSLKAQIVTRQFRYFSVTGWEPAVNDLQAILGEVEAKEPDLYPLIGTAGMLCNRRVRVPGSQSYSDHSWGSAYDSKIGGILSPQRAKVIPAGLLALYPYFHRHGWYWGLGYPVPDPMHFEPSDQRLRELFRLKNGNVFWGTP